MGQKPCAGDRLAAEAGDQLMAKDKGQVRRVLQILSPEDQETLAILHNPPLMEELLRRQETLAEVKTAGYTGELGELLAGVALPVRLFPAALDELAALPSAAREALLQTHLPELAAAPQAGLGLTQLFRGLWLSIWTVEAIDYRIIYEIDSPQAVITVLLIGTWEDLETRLGAS
jgi:mRNA-degrading endonuclease RelE of RelBE toxin-antitoxin system